MHASHKLISQQGSSRVLELLHIDSMGLMQIESLGGKRYMLVVVDDFFRYIRVRFLQEKSKVFAHF